jgi:hypothetical protein
VNRAGFAFDGLPASGTLPDNAATMKPYCRPFTAQVSAVGGAHSGTLCLFVVPTGMAYLSVLIRVNSHSRVAQSVGTFHSVRTLSAFCAVALVLLGIVLYHLVYLVGQSLKF